MKKCTIKILRNNKKILDSIDYADDFFSRLVGLMFRKKIDDNYGILITQCNSIHTCFMNFPIDVVFLNKEMKVVKIIKNIPPWRMTSLFLNAYYALELKGNNLETTSMVIGDQLEVLCLN